MEWTEDLIRRDLLKQRKLLTSEEVSRRSGIIVSRFLETLDSYHLEGLRIGIYRSLPFEVELRALEKGLRTRGVQLSYPRMKNSEWIEFVEVPEEKKAEQPESWKSGPYGISEPCPELPALELEALDVILVPGVAFGENGERIGMGKGYYDRFLTQEPQALRVALAFDFQVFPNLPQKPTDQPVHWILTEVREWKGMPAEDWLKKRILK